MDKSKFLILGFNFKNWLLMPSGSRVRPKTLQVVDVPIIDNRQCEDWHSSKGINVIIYDEMMCAGYRNGGKDSCQVNSTTTCKSI
jgi:transmembrane serine protease 6